MTSKTKEFRSLASKIRRSCDCDLRISRRFDRLEQAIKREEKEHRKGRGSYRPLCYAVDLFIIKTLNHAFEKIDGLKASDLDVRDDYLFALQLISDSRDREILEPYREQIAAMADRLDYCEDIVIK